MGFEISLKKEKKKMGERGFYFKWVYFKLKDLMKDR